MDFIMQQIFLISWFSCVIFLEYEQFNHIGIWYSAEENSKPRFEHLSIDAEAPHLDCDRFWIRLFRVLIFAVEFVKCCLNEGVLSRETQTILGFHCGLVTFTHTALIVHSLLLSCSSENRKDSSLTGSAVCNYLLNVEIS